MITFSNWRISSNQKIIALQHDHKTCTLTVSGDLPEGWNWELILFSGGLPDEIPLTPSSDGVSARSLLTKPGQKRFLFPSAAR